MIYRCVESSAPLCCHLYLGKPKYERSVAESNFCGTPQKREALAEAGSRRGIFAPLPRDPKIADPAILLSKTAKLWSVFESSTAKTSPRDVFSAQDDAVVDPPINPILPFGKVSLP